MEFWLSLVFLVLFITVRSDVDGKGKKRLWQVGNW